jgi:aryl-alcohol dehydrogenase-like predicted oxidoreductase
MQYRTFGRLNWKVSSIGFGAWAIGGSWGPQSQDDSVKALHTALDLGCNFIDTAQVYGDGRSERVIAQALEERKRSHPGERIYVATKIPPSPDGEWPPSPYDSIDDRYSESYLRTRLERSLRDLKTDCIDLVQLHSWTRAWNRQPRALETLRKFQKEGKLLGIGVSTPEHDQNSLVDLMAHGWLDAVQVIYNIFEQEPQAEFFPVAALKFALKPQAVSTVIAGIRNPDQARQNCAVSDMPPLSNELETKLRKHNWRRAFWYGGK